MYIKQEIKIFRLKAFFYFFAYFYIIYRVRKLFLSIYSPKIEIRVDMGMYLYYNIYLYRL